MEIIRKSTIDLNRDEWNSLNQAINELVGSGVWHKLVMHHGDRSVNHKMHGSTSGEVGYARFLYWHRAYIIECENALRKINKDVTIPYWDWLNNNTVPTGLDHTSIAGVERNEGIIDFTNPRQINNIMNHNTFNGFVKDLGHPHNEGHNWVGGVMSHPMHSPTDPLFYMHHANVDRIWSEWQSKQENADKKPTKPSNADNKWDKLDPWENKWNIDNVHDVSNIGGNSYKYK